ncbi:MAG: 30S ribosomal protein S18 [Candidatus Dojkabacteria bacterium]|nr:MAG: 30S ribosomal protein S18 [Candidatus Dojkabacteria bacterium]
MAVEEIKTSTEGGNFEDKSSDERAGDDRGSHRRRKRVNLNLKCPLCEGGVGHVSYKDVYQLKKFTSVRGKIISTEKSGVCHKHQKELAQAIKRARYMALLPYVAVEA